MANELTNIKLEEVSVVDRPANPGAVIALWKRDASLADKEEYEIQIQKAASDRRRLAAVTETLQNQQQQLQTSAATLRAESDIIRAQTAELLVAKEKQMAENQIKKSSMVDGLEALAAISKRDGETVEGAMLRVMREDPAASVMYEAHEKAVPASLAELRKACGTKQTKEDPEDAADLAEIEERAKKIRKRDGSSEPQAFLKAMTERPEIYDRMEVRKAARSVT